jgi:hypothetical protein
MLTAAAEQIERAGTRAGNLIAYGILSVRASCAPLHRGRNDRQ